MKITNQQVIDTVKSIRNLATLNNAAKANFALAKNLNKLKQFKTDYDDTHSAIFKKHFGDELEIKGSDSRLRDFQEEIKTLLTVEIDYEPHRFTKEDLRLDGPNGIKPDDLENISWLISDF